MKLKRLHSSREQPQEESLLNLTPLIDVVFVVLIMFIIIAPMLELDRVELATAARKEDKRAVSVDENNPVVIHVRGDNTIWIRGKQMTQPQLISYLREAKQRYPHRIPQLFQDRKATFGTYQSVKNAIEMSGFEQLDVILQPG